MDTYCGVFSCELERCKYHIKNAERMDIRHNYLNMSGSDKCEKAKKETSEGA